MSTRNCSQWYRRVIVMLLLALTLATINQPQAAVAQDGGGQILSVTPLLQLDARGFTDNKLCRGKTVTIPVSVEMTVESPSGVAVGSVNVRSVRFTVGAQDPSIAHAQAVMNPAGLAVSLIPARIDVTGLQPGSTTIDVEATITTETFVELDEEVALPIPRTAEIKGSIPIQVVPCQYRVDILSTWDTHLLGASALYLYSLPNERLSSTTGTSFENETSNALNVQWTGAINRIRGCLVSSLHFSDYVPMIRAVLGTETLSLSIQFHEIAPGMPFARQLCPVPSGITQGDCPSYPDGHCFVSPRPSVFRWTPHMPAEGLVFSINGEVQTVSQTLTHPEGTAQGTMFIIVTPILSQGAPD